MVRVIVFDAREAENRKDLLGTWLNDSHYDELINEDCDLYVVGNTVDGLDEPSEKNVIFKLRKNFYTEEEMASAIEGLADAAVESQNRGIAGGPRIEGEGPAGDKGRQWVTDLQYELLEYFADGQQRIMLTNDPIKEIRDNNYNTKSVSSRGTVWLKEKIEASNFVFDDWIKNALTLDVEEASKQAQNILDNYISKTTYANAVNSGIAGWYDRYPRIPYGRPTSYTEHNFDKFKKSYKFLEKVAKGYSEMLPWRFNNQNEASKNVDERFRVPNTPFTTITVNKNFRTAAHYDPANMEEGFANISVVSRNPNYDGCYLVFPEIRKAVNIRPGDLLLVNNQSGLHGNTQFISDDPNYERISIIAFFHEGMKNLGDYDYEMARKEFVDHNKLETWDGIPNPRWKPRFNGVFPGMFSSQEWYDYLKAKLGEEVLLKYHPESKSSSLDDFFN